MKLTAVAESKFFIGFASIHFVNLSTDTRICVNPDVPVLSGPIMSNPHVAKGHARGCKARYAVLYQIRTFPPEPEDEAHIGPTATYDEVIYPGFQHDITTLQLQGYTSHTIGIQLPEYITTAEDTCLSTDYKQCLVAKVKHTKPTYTWVQALRPGTPS